MSDAESSSANQATEQEPIGGTTQVGESRQVAPIIVQLPKQSSMGRWLVRGLVAGLLISIMLNFVLYSTTVQLTRTDQDKLISGNAESSEKIVIIDINGTIIPPFTERVIRMIDRARDDEDVKGVLLSIDSPGGLVADSHQIHRKLQKLVSKKPVWVSMKRIAASGGVYVAMGVGPQGKIYAEPTTWTGSIGVIIPRYDLSQIAKRYGVASDSLTTGEFKDSMNPFKPLSDADRAVWGEILEDAFVRFVGVVADGRATLDRKTVRSKLATGQIFTADQAVKNGLIDGIQFEDEILDDFQKQLKLIDPAVIRYRHPTSMVDLLLGEAQKTDPHTAMTRRLLESTVPRAMYYFSWLPQLPK